MRVDEGPYTTVLAGDGVLGVAEKLERCPQAIQEAVAENLQPLAEAVDLPLPWADTAAGRWWGSFRPKPIAL
ncbi:hypothetical protein [Streptomyces hawaiiensis]|uniref:hypothetical protein n=1 Tax=Streptomyces hawaiiensis TaxID=67305 RepID=UPI0036521D6B